MEGKAALDGMINTALHSHLMNVQIADALNKGELCFQPPLLDERACFRANEQKGLIFLNFLISKFSQPSCLLMTQLTSFCAIGIVVDVVGMENMIFSY